VKAVRRKSGNKKAFTIIELLTIMSIIIILIGMLVPALNRVKRFAKRVRQKDQFHAIDVALDLFNAEWDGYPPSSAWDTASIPQPYCGAMKLCEALLGQDLLGFHPNSQFLSSGLDAIGNELYPMNPALGPSTVDAQQYRHNLRTRKGTYLPVASANANKLKHLYGAVPAGKTGLEGERYVICDVYNLVDLRADPTDPTDSTSGQAGLPVLYYRADVSKIVHDWSQPGLSIYNILDNDGLVQLGIPFDKRFWHPIDIRGMDTSDGGKSNPKIFYDRTVDEKITTTIMPHRADSYILLSAGFDGEYGTPDDVYNFGY
jgi:competence protein ComGC